MIEILLFFIAASLLLYVVLGGADYGAGILELLPSGKLRAKEREVVNYAMGPVWEANHMWLVLVVVILFMGFPKIFNLMMVHLHIPVVALLVGIVIRGTAFTFRHYDAIHEPKSQNVYSWIFSISSLWSAFWIGVIAGSLLRGKIDPNATTFTAAYIDPWFGLVPFATGVMTICMFAFLASVYLVGETTDPELKKNFWRRGYAFNVGVVVSGGFVFLMSYVENVEFFFKFISNYFALLLVALATVLFFVLWYFVKRSQSLWVRLVGAGQVALIIFGWYVVAAPTALVTPYGTVSFFESAAPAATLRQLTLALCIGSLLIFPSLIFLLRVFKKRN